MGVKHCELEGGIICQAKGECLHIAEIRHQATKGGHKDTGELSGPHFSQSEWEGVKEKYAVIIPATQCGSTGEALIFLAEVTENKGDTGELHPDDDRFLLLPSLTE